MATKSKSTDIFKGLLSWLCLLALLCGLSLGVAFSAIVLSNPELQTKMAENLQDFAGEAGYVPPAISGDGTQTEEAETEEDFAMEIAEAHAQHEELIYVHSVQIVCALAILLTALVLVFAFRRDRRQLEAHIAALLGKVWMEIKCVFLMAALFLGLVLISEKYLPWAVCLWVLTAYFLCMDIGYNRRFFRHNIIHSVLKWLNSFKSMTTFEQRSLRRLFSTIGVIGGILAVAALLLLWALDSFTAMGRLLGTVIVSVIAFAATGVVGTIVWYVLGLKRDLQDWNALMAQITEMYGGNLNAVNHVPPTSNLYDCAMQLNMIRTGIEKAVEEGTKADRTKVELITNVSHDIKTPLTSIISYIELLKKEPGLPDHVMDYIQTISHKADRLSNIVQDVFEVSKAATGNITLNLEDLDIGKLLQQTFGEMDEVLRGSQLIWRMDIPDTPVLVHADGQRLYRVFQNLIRNCDQYALEGSRAYVSLSSQNGYAVASIRNVSRNEITMDSEDLTARFVRGDQNRTTEGSGLGLSIAKSFTEACGGTFSVRTDGDLFIVTVQFPQVNRPPV